VLQFAQSDVMASYINFKTERRKAAKSDFEKDLSKLLNNAIFGKACENKRRHKNIDLVFEAEKF
jgi:hypothetical protein